MNKSYVSYFKSIVDQDRAAVVICTLEHEIIYMNPAAVRNYEKWGGDRLLGKSLLDLVAYSVKNNYHKRIIRKEKEER